MTKQLTTTNATPIRIDAEHYQIESQSKDRLGRVYDLIFDHELRRWTCKCPDSRKNNNPRCKHVRRLSEWIKEQEQAKTRIQAQAAAIIEQEFAAPGDAEPEYREYAPPAQTPTYFTELDNRMYALEGRNQSNECEIAILDDQLRELRKALAEEREAREKLAAALEAARAEIQSLRTDLHHAISDAHRGACAYTDSVRELINDSMHTRKAEIAELRTQVTELAQVKPVRIEAQVVAVESKNGTKRVASTAEAKAEAAPQITEIERDGKLIGLEVDGYTVKVAHGMVMACPCPDGQQTYCKHCKVGEAHLEARKRGNAPLGSNKPFSLMR